jgi:hypothetical protein
MPYGSSVTRNEIDEGGFMGFCTQPWAAEMPGRTKAQREARLKRATEEAELMGRRRDVFYGMWVQALDDWREACNQIERMRTRARG